MSVSCRVSVSSYWSWRCVIQPTVHGIVDKQVTAILISCFYQLRQLRVVKRSLTRHLFKPLFTADCRLLQCLIGRRSSQLKRLQSAQNTSARLVLDAVTICHVPILHSLHWLPIRQRVTFKIALLVWKCVHGADPACRKSVSRSKTSEGAHA